MWGPRCHLQAILTDSDSRNGEHRPDALIQTQVTYVVVVVVVVVFVVIFI